MPDPLDSHQRAWVESFFDENHLNYYTSPELVASPAQMRFMVTLKPDQRFFPCTQRVFDEILVRVKSPILGDMYSRIWSRLYHLMEKIVEDPEERTFLMDLLNIKYQHETSNFNVIPSRVEKRLFKLFKDTTQIEDPLQGEKEALNLRALALYQSPAFIKTVNQPAGVHQPAPCFEGETVESLRRHLDATKLRRLIQASVHHQFLDPDSPLPSESDWDKVFNQPVSPGGWEPLENFLLTPREDLLGYWVQRKILYLADKAGEIVFDLAVVKFLVRLGHVVILAVKQDTFYDLVCLRDITADPTLRSLTSNAEILTDPRLTKNQLAASLRNGRPFKVLSDGTMEEINLTMTSVTFARVFKEVDGIISKGPRQRVRFIDSPFGFTQDICSLVSEPDTGLSVAFKPRSSDVIRMTTTELEDRASKIISDMRDAKAKGSTVMFYSGIVGSIPGQTETAIKVMTTFVGFLLEQQADTFIINPSTYFAPGMDADDLMYMWEIVQRSGLIDIWRFQSYQDIEKSFELQGQKVPPQWVGKDSTFSTGCTKERIIADEVQTRYPEMQIIGPDREKFIRRSEYGVGSFHDTRLSQLYDH